MRASSCALLREFQGRRRQTATSDEAILHAREDVALAERTKE
jgi:hypothetical protein